MSQNTYNGWTNYATWRVNLEIFDGVNPYDLFDSIKDTYAFAESLKDFAQEIVSQSSGEGLALDYAMAFLDDVNWREIAEGMQQTYDEDGEIA